MWIAANKDHRTQPQDAGPDHYQRPREQVVQTDVGVQRRDQEQEDPQVERSDGGEPEPPPPREEHRNEQHDGCGNAESDEGEDGQSFDPLPPVPGAAGAMGVPPRRSQPD
jgi:hypothetical protein